MKALVSFWPSLTLGVIVGLIALGAVAINTALEGAEFEDKPIIIHMHASLRIIVHGEPVTIPEGIGMVPSLYHTHVLDRYGIQNPKTYPLHTHDTSGIIHIESNDIKTFTLGQFFDVWGKRFDENCILDKCNDGANRVTMYVNGIENSDFEDYVLKNNDIITIVYGIPKAQSQV